MTLDKAKISESLNAFNAVENIFKDLSSGKAKFAPPAATPAIDVSRVEVPKSVVESILDFAIEKKTGKPVERFIEEVQIEEEVEERVDEEVVAQNKLSDLVLRLSALLKEARDFLNEMTTTGMIGTNQKFSLFKKKKNGSTKTTKRN